MPASTKPSFIFDTSPLITLATPKIEKQVAIDYILPLIVLAVVETVAQESTANPTYSDAAVIQSRLDSGHIARIPVPVTSVDHLINGYTNIGTTKGKGERDTIRLGITLPSARIVLDDQGAFFIAARFDLKPIMMLDVLVDLTRSRYLDKLTALKIVNAVSQTGRYATASIQHTIYKLNEVLDDSDNY